MPISLTLPTDGQSDWDVPLNEALTDLEAFVNGLETAVGGKLDTTAAAELIRDTIGAALVAGTNVTVTVDDSGNTITIAATGSGGLDAEGVRDTMAAALTAGTGISITVNDAGDTITIDATGGGSVPDATSSVKGVVQLAGDLGGTAAAPTVVAASDTVAGKVELATTAEATTGTDTARAVTPAGLKAVADTKAATSHTHAAVDVTSGTLASARLPAASETAQGAVELATNTEATTGTDTVRAMTPANTAAVIAALLAGAPLAEVVRDTMGAALVAGSGVTLTVNDGADTITVAQVKREVTFSVPLATLATGTGTLRYPNTSGVTRTIDSVRIDVNTAPTGASLIVDVNKGGTTIFTTQSNRPTIVASAFNGTSGTPNVQSWASGDYLQFDIDQVGSTVAGGWLTITVLYS